MGARGPRPTPTALLKARGSKRASINKNEPTPELAPPPCPDWLEPDARSFWLALVPELERLGVLTQIDQTALARYCQAWSHWRKADAFITKYGFTYNIKSDDGKTVKCVVQWPQVSISANLSRQLLKFEQEFGLTPSARSRVQSIMQKHPSGSKPPKSEPTFMRIAK